MQTDFYRVVGAAVVGVVLSFAIALLLRWRDHRFAKRIQQQIMNDLAAKGMLSRQGEVGLVIRHVYNPEIVDSFIKSFNEAFTKTAYCSEFHNGEVRLWFKIKDVKMAEEVKSELEKAGFYVG